MESPMSSNLVKLVEDAIDYCFYNGESSVNDGMGLAIFAEWIDSRHSGYSVIHLTISENGVVKFTYDDYGTECKAD